MARILGLPSVIRVRKGGRWWYQCDGWGCFGLGDSRKEAFDNWRTAVKENSTKPKNQSAIENAS